MQDFESDRLSLAGNIAPSRRQMMTAGLASGFALAVQPVCAQTMIVTDANGLTAGEVEIKAADRGIPAYRAMPATGGPFPVVLVVQEIFGVHEHIKDVCRRLAKQGYMAIAVELYARQGEPAKIADVGQLIRELVSKVPDAQVMSDLDAAVAFAKASGNADTTKLAITGFCWGGRITWLYSTHNPGVKAGIAWYGRIVGESTATTPKHPIDLVSDLKAPVLGLYGAADQGIPVADVEMMKDTCKKAGKTCEFTVYPDTPHAFHADYRPSYRAEAAKDGWAKMLAWLKQNGVG